MSEAGTNDPEQEQRGPTVRDRRRIDPETYQVREPQSAAAPAAPDQSVDNKSHAGSGGGSGSVSETSGIEQDQASELSAALAERTADLQRLQAEYVNYKRRVDRDRDVTRRAGVESVLRDLLSVLDDVRSAREHEQLTGGFKAVAEEVERLAGKHGLEAFGEPGDAFDPHIHEALLHAHATDGITGPTCVEILQPGYRIGDKVLRPARVAVAEPGPDSDSDDAQAVTGDAPADEALAGESPAPDSTG
ncbi:MAG TPA: nucleotide exchange factor GrpE [Propionibacteriaceae bacterium]|nr:nucleotide exchange factor GrpE [Propionibacteriaceae bacterium]